MLPIDHFVRTIVEHGKLDLLVAEFEKQEALPELQAALSRNVQAALTLDELHFGSSVSPSLTPDEIAAHKQTMEFRRTENTTGETPFRMED